MDKTKFLKNWLRNRLSIIKLFICKIIKYIKIIGILNFIIYICYNIDFVRKSIKFGINTLFNEKLSSSIAYVYNNSIDIFKFIIYISLIYLAIELIIKYILKHIIRKIQEVELNKADAIYKNIKNYIESNDKKALILEGEWGVGKTYTIDTFFEKYYKYVNRKIYRISCFGIDNRRFLLDEFKNIFESEDNSLKKHLLNLVNKLPIIGDFFFNILKSGYELKDIKKNSIFIFDDFERIVTRTYDEDIHSSFRYRNTYMNRANDFNELSEIYKELKNIDQRFIEVSKNQNNIINSLKLEKYNVVIGLINELIEKYNMKVIILCNRNEINNYYFHDMFECKLESIIYKINLEKNIFTPIFVRSVRSKSYINKKLREMLFEFFQEVNLDVEMIWRKTNITNIRILSAVISAFIEIADQLDILIFDKFKYDIFYTVLISHISITLGRQEEYKNIKIGEHLLYYYNKKKMLDNNIISSSILLDSNYIKDIIWMGDMIGFSWFVGSNNINFNDIINEINNYNYSLENYILNDYKNINEDEEVYKFEDIIFLLKNYNRLRNQKSTLLNIIETKNIDFSWNLNSNHIYQINKNNNIINLIINTFVTYSVDQLIYSNEKVKNSVFKMISKNAKNSIIKSEIMSTREFEKLVESYNQWIKPDDFIG